MSFLSCYNSSSSVASVPCVHAYVQTCMMCVILAVSIGQGNLLCSYVKSFSLRHTYYPQAESLVSQWVENGIMAITFDSALQKLLLSN